MCTAATYKTKDFYFGRTLDYDFSYGEEVVVMPRHYVLPFRHMGKISSHYAVIGMAHMADGYPLYYDGANEKGLCMAGLNFVGNAHYQEAEKGLDAVAQFEFIPWILSQCASVPEAEQFLKKMRLLGEPFQETYPTAWLHWLIADADAAITVEYQKDGLHIHPNPVGILTNNPPFETQMFLLNQYMHVSRKDPKNQFAEALPLAHYSRGMGGLGLPGDLSSPSRFVRAAFTKLNSVSKDTELESVNQFFHILGSVDQARGCCEMAPGQYEITIYTSCCNADKGIYYYTTYGNHQISAVDMHQADLEGDALLHFPLRQEEQIFMQHP